MSQTSFQTQFWSPSPPGAFVGGLSLMTAASESMVMEERKVGVDSSEGRLVSGNSRWFVLSRRHGAVATHVDAKRASAFSSLVEQTFPDAVMIVLTSEDALRPDAIRLA